jgi:hypothetical protein
LFWEKCRNIVVKKTQNIFSETVGFLTTGWMEVYVERLH